MYKQCDIEQVIAPILLQSCDEAMACDSQGMSTMVEEQPAPYMLQGGHLSQPPAT